MLLIGLERAARPASEKHPFGHGKEIYFWSFVVAILFFSMGAGVAAYEGWHRIHAPEPVSDVYINYIVLVVAIVFEGLSWRVAFQEFQRAMHGRSVWATIRASKDPAVVVVFLEDTAALGGLVLALLGIFLSDVLNMPVLDGWTTLAIAVLLAATALVLILETKSLLIGESASPEVVAGIRALAAKDTRIASVIEVLTMHFGPHEVLLNLSLNFQPGLASGEVERAIADLDRSILSAYPEIRRIFIEAESVAKAGLTA